MPVLHFTYRDSSGIESERTLTSWKENSRYIQGRSATDSLPKTFRKDQVLQFHAGRGLLLGDAAPLAPAPKPKVLLDDRLQVLFTGFKASARA